MDLATYRKSLGISQEECARQLGVRSKGYISEIETDTTQSRASFRVAMRIEKWSGGKVKAATLSKEAADLARMTPGKAA